ncbi:hypothetical protein LEP1GSC036_3285 [Leptospira weilii str. 2006001853]|uniref:Uncharacterized protein n=2 Tax=Leptospira weilii TaxID=28184 RepID=A0A828Z2Z5_9LEPT|nr:hypothetical protein LEP1GSC036_3285 [Leptospira weilii str. 2006001853]EMN43666.1 hypothetical protein LEP1GSC086_3566 [Leptospira weilii str. LNT 1234]EMN89372.1 hypothetical protein LEP1GSC108_4452 [Leptospira weilii str. UI 13098]
MFYETLNPSSANRSKTNINREAKALFLKHNEMSESVESGLKR